MKALNRRWFSIKASADVAELAIFDEIGGWGVTVSDFKKEFDAVRGAQAITLLLNSPGGSVFDGMSVYNILATVREKLSVRVVGVAASAASVVALSGSKLTMGEATYLMIHNPWAVAIGPAAEMRKTAELLDSVSAQMIDIYAAHSSLTKEEIAQKMADETWLTGQEAMDAGFADEVEQGTAVAALGYGLEKYGFKKTPDVVQAKSHSDSRPPQTVRDFESFLRDAGFSRNVAASIAAKGFPTPRDAGGESAGIAQRISASVQETALREVALRN